MTKEFNAIQLEEIVYQLLWKEECVILPGMGAFITREQAAGLNPATHVIKPASKSLFFNPSIHQTDGMLANSIQEKFGMTYNDAAQCISEKVDELKEAIAQGQRIHWKGIGEFFGNEERTFFVPSPNHNFLKSSFGLPVVKLKKLESTPTTINENAPIQELSTLNTSKQQLEKEYEERYQETELKPQLEQPAPPKTKQISWKRIVAWPAAALLALSIAYIGYQNESNTYVTEKAVGFDFNPVIEGEVVESESTESTPYEAEENFNENPASSEESYDFPSEETIVSENNLEENNPENVYSENLPEEFNSSTPELENDVVSEESVHSFNTEDQFHIIIYHSLVEARAQEFTYNNPRSHALNINNSKIYRVSIMSGMDRETMETELIKLQSEYPDAYILDKSKYQNL